jgi:hypothetical protein
MALLLLLDGVVVDVELMQSCIDGKVNNGCLL